MKKFDTIVKEVLNEEKSKKWAIYTIPVGMDIDAAEGYVSSGKDEKEAWENLKKIYKNDIPKYYRQINEIKPGDKKYKYDDGEQFQ